MIHGVRLDSRVLRHIVELRETIRRDSGGGACAVAAAQALERSFGWPSCRGIYMSCAGEPISPHCWNFRPDGAIVDATADRFGEGNDVRLVLPTDADHRRYRRPALAAVLPDLAGQMAPSDALTARAEELAAARGPGWWLPDPGLLRAFLLRQEEYRLAQVRAYRDELGR